MTQDILELIKTKKEMIPEHCVYYALREYGVKRIKVPTRELTRECLALHYVGLPITVRLLEEIHRPTSNLYNLLHRLGDYKVITLVKDDKKTLRFVMNPLFLNKLKLPKGVDERGDN